MTQAQTRANEGGPPSLSQLSLAAMLRMFVALVQSVVSKPLASGNATARLTPSADQMMK
jgi:hypothetical protein